jgi:hypothetical protein
VGITVRAGANHAILEANIAFHLRAGANAIAVWAPDDASNALEVLQDLKVDERVRRVPPEPTTAEVGTRAAQELAVDWLIQTDSNEFWWPRGPSIPDVLSVVPSGCNAAQGITRTLLPTADEGPFEDVFTMRLSPRAPSIDRRWRPTRRFAVRSSSLGVDTSDLDPLWGYYPFEVLVLAVDGSVERDIAASRRAEELDVLVPDTRLSDVLGELRAAPAGHRFSRAGPALELPPVDPAEEAVFALEAAVVDELELARAREQLDALSGRLSELETSRLLHAEARVRRTIRGIRRRLRRGS